DDNNRTNYHDELHRETRLASSFIYSRRFSPQTRFKTGLFIHNILNYNFYKQTIARENISDVLSKNTNLAVNGEGSTSTLQYFAQASQNLSERTVVNGGLHLMYFPLNNTASVEPRLSIKHQVSPRQKVSLAYGLHSKILPMATYFFSQQDTINGNISTMLPNLDLPFVKAHHLIGAYDFATAAGLRFTAEVYYQRLFNVPVSPDADNLYWMLNNRPSFPEQEVVGEGKGENVGIDLAVEKFFSNQLFFLLTGSYFKSYFYPQNDLRYPSTYANNFVSSFTFGREFSIGEGKTLQVGARILYNGGNRYTPLDEAASAEDGVYVPDTDLTNSLQIPNYFRIDTRIAYRYNAPKLAGSITLDIQNLTNRQNPNGVGYSADLNQLFVRNHSSGLVPVLTFVFDF
ncbi:MAG: hypothetical protein AB8G22_21600, partial [Saprospiraceae bacterium]